MLRWDPTLGAAAAGWGLHMPEEEEEEEEV